MYSDLTTNLSLIHTKMKNLCEENVKLIVLTVYKRFLEAHKFCLCHNLLNSQWRSFIENVGLVSNFVRSDSSLFLFIRQQNNRIAGS